MLGPGSAVVLGMTNGWALKCSFSHELFFHFFFFPSNVGTHVCLLDSAQHVPDPEVLGHFGWHHIPGRQQDAGSESCEEVRGGQSFNTSREEVTGCCCVPVTTAWGSWTSCVGLGCSWTSLPLELSRAVPRVQLLHRELAMWFVLKEAQSSVRL